MAEVYSLDAVVEPVGDDPFPDYRTVAICQSVETAKKLVADHYVKRILWMVDEFGSSASVQPLWQLDGLSVIGWCILKVELDTVFSELTLVGGKTPRQ